MDELKRAATDISEVEIARARTQMKAGMLMGLESPSNRAERLARMLAIWDRIPDLDEIVERIDAVNATDVRGFAEKMAHGNEIALALYGPMAADAPDLDGLKRRLAS